MSIPFYLETGDREERAPHMRFIDKYDEGMFWSLLASKLASRDVAAVYGWKRRFSAKESTFL